jgi:hypothetical protein
MMGNPIATKTSGYQCFAFPDVCDTQVGQARVPIPYPNMGDLGDAQGVSPDVFAGGDAVILGGENGSEIPETTGDEAGSLGGVRSHSTRGRVTFNATTTTVYVNSKPVIRMFDTTQQNYGNAMGRVLGGCPTVFVGDYDLIMGASES